jgi:DNA-binding SARP family transcriptional activator
MTEDEDTGLRFQLLGPVRGWRGAEELDLGPSYRRALLAVLAFAVERTVSRQELIDALWGDTPPSSVNGSLYTYVSSLRGALEPDRPRRGDSRLLTSVGSGYSLRVPPEALDLHRLASLHDTARRYAERGATTAAVDALDTALALWHGEALSGLPGPYLATQRARLAEVRLNILERRADLLLALGRQAELVEELTALCAEHPVREPMHGLLMRALHACGRTPEALAVFAELRTALLEGSGIDPGPELRSLHQRMMESGQESGEDLQLGTVRAGSPLLPTRPDRTTHFTGRRAEIDLLRAAVTEAGAGRGGVVWIEGEPGIGKSALLAEALADVPDERIRWANAHQLDRLVPLHLIRTCLGLPEGHRREWSDAVAAEGFQQVITAVRRLCADGPLILAVDDLQWADEASLEAWWRLHQLEGLPLLLIGAGRQVPRSPALERLRERTAGRCVRLPLGPLDPGEVHELVEGLTGGPPRDLPQVRPEDGAGNPLYVRRIVTSLPAGGRYAGIPARAGRDEDYGLPARLISLVNEHLMFLSTGTVATLRQVALLAGQVTEAELTAATGRGVGELAEQLSEALAAGVLERTDDGFGFRHPIVRRALYEKTPAALRGALHRGLAEALATGEVAAYRVAEQLVAVRAAADHWVVEWISANITAVAIARPQIAVQLLRRATSYGTLPPKIGESLATMLAWLLLWLGEDPEAEARSAIMQTLDPGRGAEMRWILAYVYHRRGQHAAARLEINRTLADSRVTGDWRARHEALWEALYEDRLVGVPTAEEVLHSPFTW